MEQETKGTDGVGQGGGLVPDVLGQVGAGAIPGVLPVQRGSEVEDDTLPPRTAEALDCARFRTTKGKELEALADDMAEVERELAEARAENERLRAEREQLQANADMWKGHAVDILALIDAEGSVYWRFGDEATLDITIKALRRWDSQPLPTDVVWAGVRKMKAAEADRKAKASAMFAEQDDDPRHDPTRMDHERDEALGRGAWSGDGREE